MTFVDRFDANSYLYITRAMDYFDLAADYGGVLAEAFRGTKSRFCLVSFTSDWLFPTSENKRDRACAERGGRQCQLRRDRERPRPRRLPAGRARAVRHHKRVPERGRLRQGREMNALPQGRPRDRPASRSRGHRRDDPAFDARARHRLRRRRAAGISGAREGRRRPRARTHPAERQPMRGARASRWCRATPTPTSRNIPSGVFDIVILSQTIQATRRPRFVLERAAAHRQAHDRLVPEFRSLAGAGVAGREGTHAGDESAGPRLARHAEHPSVHDRRFPRRSRTRSARASSRPGRCTKARAPSPCGRRRGATISSRKARSSCSQRIRRRRPSATTSLCLHQHFVWGLGFPAFLAVDLVPQYRRATVCFFPRELNFTERRVFRGDAPRIDGQRIHRFDIVVA